MPCEGCEFEGGSKVKNLTVKKAAGALGAFVENLDIVDVLQSNVLQQAMFGVILEHEVVFLREQAVDAKTFAALAETFGQVLPHGAYPTVTGVDQVQILESTAAAPSKIELWHSDMTFTERPPSYTFLHAQVIPEFGGDTLWASASAAYLGLSVPMQTLLNELQAEHDFRHGFRESLAEPGGEARLADAISANPPVVHPLIRTHPQSGRKAIYVNALFTTRILGLSKLESDALLAFLYRHITNVEFTVRLRWQPGTLAIWDNRGTQHKPVNDFGQAHRKMHRVTIVGDRPA